LQKRKSSIDVMEPMRVCENAFSPEWTSTEAPAKIVALLEALLAELGAQFSKKTTPYFYDFKLPPAPAHRLTKAIKCEVELMSLKKCPFVTLVRVN